MVAEGELEQYKAALLNDEEKEELEKAIRDLQTRGQRSQKAKEDAKRHSYMKRW